MTLTPSATCVALVKSNESCRLRAFKPTPDDVWTLGWGRTVGIKQGMTCTQAQADAWFVADLASFASGVWNLLDSAPTTQGQFDAMVSLAYNIGIGAFMASSVLTNHKAGHYTTAAWAFGLWNKQTGSDEKLHVLNGLITRRALEAAMYAGKPK